MVGFAERMQLRSHRGGCLFEKAFLETLNFGQDLFRFGFHLKVDKLQVLFIRYAHLILDGIEHLQNSCKLVLRQPLGWFLRLH